ncbi:MAG: inositol monophosphatase family protein, partial [Pseudomonadota bacterium]
MTQQSSALIQIESILNDAVEVGLSWSTRRAELSIDEKSLGQFASNADLEIEQLVRAKLGETFPGEAIIGEEYGGALSAEQSGWAIDPIDGTSNFILGLPIWAISFGYLDQGRSVLGGVAIPDLGLIISAQDGCGLRLNGT